MLASLSQSKFVQRLLQDNPHITSLLQAMSDEQLERSVAAAFARFGRCFAKIRRDSKGMPFAFVQYEVRVPYRFPLIDD